MKTILFLHKIVRDFSHTTWAYLQSHLKTQSASYHSGWTQRATDSVAVHCREKAPVVDVGGRMGMSTHISAAPFKPFLYGSQMGGG